MHFSRYCKLCLLLPLALFISSAWGKGYRNGYQPPVRDPSSLSHNYTTALLPEKELPGHFDWCRNGGVDYCVPSWSQHEPVYCGACWLHATMTMISDRMKIRKGGLGPDVMLGRQSMLNCGAYHNMGAGCDGGDPIDVFHYMSQYGLPDESCLSYTATDHRLYNQSVESCPYGARCRNCMPKNGTDTCWAVKTPILYGLHGFGQINASLEEYERAMRSEIFKHGPIACSVATPDDFTYGYRSGIWHDSSSTEADIDHDVEIVGWGERNGKKFWRVRNSWGVYWGVRADQLKLQAGFFELERGVNSLFIENQDCWVAEPDYRMEQDVMDGKYDGSMYGLVDAQKPQRMQPAMQVS